MTPGIQRSVCEHYFSGDSKNMFYVLGVLYPCYIPDYRSDKGIVVRCEDENLLDIVKRELGSNYATLYDSRGKNSYWVQIRNKHLRSAIEDRGLVADKNERSFPYMEEEFIDHFIRGFFDAQARIKRLEDGRNEIMFLFNNTFLAGLNHVLRKDARVERKDSPNNLMTYTHKDAIKIYDFIYRDWNFIEENNLYLPSKKDMFNPSYIYSLNNHKAHVKAFQRCERAKELARQGKRGREIAEILHFASNFSFYNSFEKITGQSFRQYVKSIKEESKDLVSI